MKFVESELEKAVEKSLGKTDYRITLAVSFVCKFLCALRQKLSGEVMEIFLLHLSVLNIGT